MTQIQISPMPGPQTDFLLSTARYPGYFAGRRGGKTTASVFKMVMYLIENPGAYGMFTMPTMGDIDRYLLPKMNEFFGSQRGSTWHWLEKKAQLVFPAYQRDGDGGIVFVRPAGEPESCRGPTLAFAAMDEVGTENQEETFRIIQPAVLGGQPGYPKQIWVTGTPRDTKPWIRMRWQDHINPITGENLVAVDYPIFKMHTRDNTHLDPTEIQALIDEWGTSRQAQQELGGEFLSVDGVAFELVEGVHLRSAPADINFTKVVYGLDMGLTSPTSITELKQDESKRIWATDEFYKRDAKEEEWMQWLADHNAQKVVCDPSASDKQIQYWRQRYGIYIVRSRARSFDDRVKLWDDGTRLHEDGLPNVTITPKCINLWNEMLNLAYRKNRHQEYAHDQWAVGVSDHAFDSSSYGLSDFSTGTVRRLEFVRRVA